DDADECRGAAPTPHTGVATALSTPNPASASSTDGAPRIRTLTSDDTPGSCIVTPYTASAASVVVRGLCVMTMNCVRDLNCVSMLTKRPTFASSSGASTSSSRQKGL